MKITKTQLRQIIKEELARSLNESDFGRMLGVGKSPIHYDRDGKRHGGGRQVVSYDDKGFPKSVLMRSYKLTWPEINTILGQWKNKKE